MLGQFKKASEGAYTKVLAAPTSLPDADRDQSMNVTRLMEVTDD